MALQSFTANEAKTHFGEFLDQAQRGPVQVTRHQRVVGVLVSAEDYEAMRAFYANRLVGTLAHAGDYAAQQGVTEQALQDLLADDR
jgi:prevent-host-death family protein